MFDLFCYAVAIVSLLAFVGRPRSAAAPAPAPVEPAPAPETPAVEPAPAPDLFVAPAAAVEPAPAPASPFAGLGRDRLRAECQARGIRWSKAVETPEGRRHLRVSEMIAALEAIGDQAA